MFAYLEKGNFMKTENNYDVIRYILRKYASREKPIARKEIEDLRNSNGL